jgi:hypothetical protein
MSALCFQYLASVLTQAFYDSPDSNPSFRPNISVRHMAGGESRHEHLLEHTKAKEPVADSKSKRSWGSPSWCR